MIKQLSLLAVAGLVFMVTTETETYGQGFGGYHRTARNLAVARGVNVGVRGAAYRPYGYRGPGYGAYGYRVPYGSSIDSRGNVILPPKPGKGPVGIDNIGNDAKKGDDTRSSARDALSQSLNQMKLPSDAGLPVANPAGAKTRKNKK